jgi:hypothetical protein
MEVDNMSQKKAEEERRGLLIGGSITLGVGLIFLLINFGVFPDIGRMWPMFPIIVGIALIIGSFYKSKKADKSEQPPA